MLYIIGLGLGDERDITLKGLDAVKKCEKVYIEAYTSLLSFGLSTDGLSTLVLRIFFLDKFAIFEFSGFSFVLRIFKKCQEKLYGKPIILADREMVEEKVDNILSEARGSDVAFLVVGDPFGYNRSFFPVYDKLFVCHMLLLIFIIWSFGCIYGIAFLCSTCI